MARGLSRERYMRDDWHIRLGNLSSSLGKVSTYAQDSRYDDRVFNLLRECARLIEWNARSNIPEAILTELAPMQRELLLWYRLWPVDEARPLLILHAQNMSDRVLMLSGLLEMRAA